MTARMYEQDPKKTPTNTTANNNAITLPVGYIKEKDKSRQGLLLYARQADLSFAGSFFISFK